MPYIESAFEEEPFEEFSGPKPSIKRTATASQVPDKRLKGAVPKGAVPKGAIPKGAVKKAPPLKKAAPPGSAMRLPPPVAAEPELEEAEEEFIQLDTSVAAAASPSPSSTDEVKPPVLARGDSYRDFSDVDPLYALVGEMGDKKVVNADGSLNDDRVVNYIERLMRPGVAKKTKQWVEIWAAMNIPVASQMHVAQKIIEVGLESEAPELVPDILAELVRGHRVKIKAVEEILVTLFECGSDQSSCLSRFLLLIFPKSPSSEWGWSRVGWSWKEWWNTTERILNTLETYSAYEMLSELLRGLETESGCYLPHQAIWDEKRLSVVRASLCQYGGFQEDELSSALGIDLGGEQPAG